MKMKPPKHQVVLARYYGAGADANADGGWFVGVRGNGGVPIWLLMIYTPNALFSSRLA